MEEHGLFGRLPLWVVEGGLWAQMTPAEVKVYGVMLVMADFNTGACFPSSDTFARKTGLTGRSIRRAIHLLNERGLIHTAARPGRTSCHTLARGPKLHGLRGDKKASPKAKGRTPASRRTVTSGVTPVSGGADTSVRGGRTPVSGERELAKTTQREKTSSLSTVQPLVRLHLQLSPVAQQKHRPGLVGKLAELVRDFSPAEVKDALLLFSPRGGQGDGLGPVYKALREGLVKAKQREEAFQENVAEDREQVEKLGVKPSPRTGDAHQIRESLSELSFEDKRQQTINALLKSERSSVR